MIRLEESLELGSLPAGTAFALDVEGAFVKVFLEHERRETRKGQRGGR